MKQSTFPSGDFSRDRFAIDKRRVREAFERAAPAYDHSAALQREVGQRLLERLDDIRLAPRRIVDAGAGTGLCADALARRYKKAHVIALDIAPAMLTAARARAGLIARLSGRRQFVCGDAERLPFAAQSVDLIFSNLTLQWLNGLDAVFAEFRRVLRPGGMLLFTTLGPDTLKELRACWAEVDGHTHVNAFLDMHDVGDALLRARLADPVMDVERITVTHNDAHSLMRELKTLGAHNVTAGRPRGLTGKQRLRAVAEAYESYRRDGALPATYEVVYGHACVLQHANAGAPHEQGTFHFPLTRLKQTLK